MAGVGVIGLGYWGPNLLRNITANRRTEKVVICDKDPGRLNKIGARFASCHKTLDCADIFNDPEIDAVVIATTVSTHYPLAMEAMKAGKHVFVEKPFAETTAKAEEMVAFAEEKKLVSMVGHTFLYSPPVLKIKQILDSKELGDIRFITSNRVNLGLHQKDVSVIWDLAPTTSPCSSTGLGKNRISWRPSAMPMYLMAFPMWPSSTWVSQAAPRPMFRLPGWPPPNFVKPLSWAAEKC